MTKWTIEDYEIALRKCKDENAALREQLNTEKEVSKELSRESTSYRKRLEDSERDVAALLEQVDELKMQYEGVKLVNIELQSKLNGYKVIYDSLNERYVANLKQDAALREQNRKLEMFNQDIVESSKKVQDLNARLVAELEKLEWSGGNAVERICPKCGVDSTWTDLQPHRDHCSIGNLLAEVRSKK